MKKRILCKAAAAVFYLMLPWMALTCQAGEDVISEGVFINGVDVSGMTAAEAETVVQQQVQALSDSVITLTMDEDQESRTWGELGLQWKNTDLITEISHLGTTGNIVQRYKEQKDLQNQNIQFEIEYTIDEDALRSFVEGMSAYNSEPVEGSVYMGDDGLLYVEGGTDGLTLDVDATLTDLEEYIEGWTAGDTVIEATVERVSPEVTAETLSKMTDVLGTATTDYSASSAARAQNIVTGTSKINGTLLMPGESFSVTDAVVPFTAENGYELAPSYESGQVVDSYGGGICQVSTTLYNAVLKAELQVDQRSNHTMTVSYVDPSKDAAIAEGLMDLVFTNTLETPVYIAGSAYGGVLNFTIYGEETRPANRTIEFVSEVTARTDATNNIQLVAKTDQNVGYLVQVQTPHEGLSAVLWKNIYYDGVLSETIQVNSSTYQATAAIWEVGVVSSNTALTSALYSAIGQNSLEQVQALLANGVQTEAAQTETTQTEAPQTEAAQTEAPQTQAAQTETPQTQAPAAQESASGTGGDVTIIQ